MEASRRLQTACPSQKKQNTKKQTGWLTSSSWPRRVADSLKSPMVWLRERGVARASKLGGGVGATRGTTGPCAEYVTALARCNGRVGHVWWSECSAAGTGHSPRHNRRRGSSSWFSPSPRNVPSILRSFILNGTAHASPPPPSPLPCRPPRQSLCQLPRQAFLPCPALPCPLLRSSSTPPPPPPPPATIINYPWPPSVTH